MLEPEAPPTRNGHNTGSLAPGKRRRVIKKREGKLIKYGMTLADVWMENYPPTIFNLFVPTKKFTNKLAMEDLANVIKLHCTKEERRQATNPSLECGSPEKREANSLAQCG